MKLLVKTLNQKTLQIDIEETQRVWDLKKQLHLYPDVGVTPEYQKLIYAGKVLEDDKKLSDYKIDVKKFLVVMILKQPLEASPSQAFTAAADAQSKVAAEEPPKIDTDLALPTPTNDNEEHSAAAAAAAAPRTELIDNENAALVQSIVNMGYPECEVRVALNASFNNPERAIEYLIEGIPTSTSELGGEAFLGQIDDIAPFTLFRQDPLFRSLRTAIREQPDLINSAIQRVGESNPALLGLITENQQDFLNMLLEESDEEDDDDDDPDENN